MKKYFLILLVVFAFVLSGCSAKEDYNMGYEDPNSDGEYNNDDSKLVDPDPITTDPNDQGGDSVDSSSNPAPALENRKIIYRASLNMSVNNPNSVYNDVLTTLEDYTAYIEEADITTNRYSLTIRVLSTEFDQLVEEIKTSGTLVAYSKTSEDVTNTYSTYEAKLEALETRHARILELISEATNLDTILMLEEERYEIESDMNYYGQKLANYDSLVDYSTITLLITEAKEEIIVLPRTEIPSVIFQEITKNSMTLEVYNPSENNVTLQVDVYLNGEFVEEYEENVFGESKTIVTFDDLKSNKEYTIKVTALADEHRVSLVDTYRRTTEATYGNKTTNTFVQSVDILVVIFEFLGLAITGLLPFAITIGVVYIPVRLYLKKRKGKTTITFVDKEE